MKQVYSPYHGYEISVAENDDEFEAAKAYARKMREAAEAFDAEFGIKA